MGLVFSKLGFFLTVSSFEAGRASFSSFFDLALAKQLPEFFFPSSPLHRTKFMLHFPSVG